MVVRSRWSWGPVCRMAGRWKSAVTVNLVLGSGLPNPPEMSVALLWAVGGFGGGEATV